MKTILIFLSLALIGCQPQAVPAVRIGYPPESDPIESFNPKYSRDYIRVYRLEDGTRCAVYGESIVCDWQPAQRGPQ